jgi:hypothetical protein
MTIGVDLGDVWSHYCTLNQDSEVVDRGRFRTTPKAIEKWFTDAPHKMERLKLFKPHRCLSRSVFGLNLLEFFQDRNNHRISRVCIELHAITMAPV